MRFKITAAAGLSLLLAAPFQILLRAQASSSTHDGVYTIAQAIRGRSSYTKACASCHGDTLEGVGQIPPLAGSDFTAHWVGQPLDELFEKMQTSMPADHPGQISRSENADILAYLLRVNKLPAGDAQLASSAAALKQIQFDEPAASH